MLEALAYSEFSQWMIVSPWAYPALLTVHGLGMACVTGLTVMVSLRILGFPAGVPLAAYRAALPVGLAAFAVNAGSGFALFAADAVALWANPSFQFKLVSIAVGVALLWLIARGPMRRAAAEGTFVATGADKALALSAILIWTAAVIISGRLIAYLAPDLFAL